MGKKKKQNKNVDTVDKIESDKIHPEDTSQEENLDKQEDIISDKGNVVSDAENIVSDKENVILDEKDLNKEDLNKKDLNKEDVAKQETIIDKENADNADSENKEKLSQKFNFEKKAVSSLTRILGIIFSVVLFMGAAGVCFYFGSKSKTEEKSNLLYTYTFKNTSKYKVKLVGNELISDEYLDEGKIYSKKITDFILVNFNSQLKTSKTLNFSGDYYIDAVIEGFQKDAESKTPIYEKRFRLKSSNITKDSDTNVVVDENIEIKPTQYLEEVTKAEEILGGATDKEFYLVFGGTIHVNDEVSPADKSFESKVTMNILDSNPYYSILKPEDKDEVEQVNTTTEEVVKNSPLFFFAGVVLFIIGVALVVYILLFTKVPNEDEKYELKLKKSLKKNMSRMVMVVSLPDFEDRTLVEVAEIEDLFMIADEIRQPVLYSLDEKELPVEGSFYLYAKDIVYVSREKR